VLVAAERLAAASELLGGAGDDAVLAALPQAASASPARLARLINRRRVMASESGADSSRSILAAIVKAARKLVNSQAGGIAARVRTGG
jgi:hypothetical protein